MVGVLLWWFVTFWNSPPTTLGEASFREAVRRHHTSSSTRVVNDASLGPAPVRTAVPPTPVIADTAAGVALTPPEPEPKPEAAKDQAWWQKRITTAREAVARDRLLVAALESRVAALANDIASRDDPEHRAVLITARQQALAELDRLKVQVTDGVAAIAAIQDEARKAGVPAGWVRD